MRKNTDIRIYFLYVLFFFITSCIGIKNNKHNAVFQHIPTEIDDVVIAKFKRPCYLRLMKEKWVDSVYNAMTFDEKVGQLFMVAAT
jgi:hypothetical protein